MINFTKKRKIFQFNRQSQEVCQGKAGAAIENILTSGAGQSIIANCRSFRQRLYTPLKTLIMFTKQLLSSDKSCRHAIAGEVAEQLSQRNTSCSPYTGAYCKARQRLPEETVRELVVEVGKAGEQQADKGWKWRGREVKIADGTTCTMSDTPANQARFPQHKNQAKGAGFPILRLVALMSLTTGMILDYAMDAYKGKGTGEHALFRSISQGVHPGDILLGDRYYPSFFLLADLIQKGADGLFQGQAQRHYDFRTGKALGKKDHLVKWKKPVKPEWMDQATYDTIPITIQIREFKVHGVVYVTTLLDSKDYHKKDLAKLYQLRWQVEINLRSIKTVLAMEHLSSKSPEMVKKEIGMHFLGYNVIRTLITRACRKYSELHPNQVSFKGTVQLLNQFLPYFTIGDATKSLMMYNELLQKIILNKIGNRPGRVEPRAIKRRRKSFPLLKNLRKVEQKKLMKKRSK